jgi:hypothetical protein
MKIAKTSPADAWKFAGSIVGAIALLAAFLRLLHR